MLAPTSTFRHIQISTYNTNTVNKTPSRPKADVSAAAAANWQPYTQYLINYFFFRDRYQAILNNAGLSTNDLGAFQDLQGVLNARAQDVTCCSIFAIKNLLSLLVAVPPLTV